jgi:hypothetical protein
MGQMPPVYPRGLTPVNFMPSDSNSYFAKRRPSQRQSCRLPSGSEARRGLQSHGHARLLQGGGHAGCVNRLRAGLCRARHGGLWLRSMGLGQRGGDPRALLSVKLGPSRKNVKKIARLLINLAVLSRLHRPSGRVDLRLPCRLRGAISPKGRDGSPNAPPQTERPSGLASLASRVVRAPMEGWGWRPRCSLLLQQTTAPIGPAPTSNFS